MSDTLKNLPATFYSRAFYQDLSLRSGLGYGFVIFIFIFCFIGGSVRMHEAVKEFSVDMKRAFEAMPGTKVKDKKLTIDKPSPYIIDLFHENDQTYKLMFDTSFNANRLDKTIDYMEEKKVFVLVTADKIATRGLTPHGKFEIRDLDMGEGDYTEADWAKAGEKLTAWLYPVSMIAVAVGLFIWANVATFFMTIITLCIGFVMKVELGFDAAMRITAATGVPVAVIGAILWLPAFPVILLWAGYAIFAVSCVKTASPRVG